MVESTKRKGGRRKIVISDEQIKKIEMLAGIGMTIREICGNLQMSHETLYKRMAEDPRIERAMYDGRAKAASQIASTLYKMAASGENVAATIFWLKTRLSWREKTEIDVNLKPVTRFRTTIEPDGTLLQQILEEDGLQGVPQLEGDRS